MMRKQKLITELKQELSREGAKFDFDRLTDEELRRIKEIQDRTGKDLARCTQQDVEFLTRMETKTLIQ